MLNKLLIDHQWTVVLVHRKRCTKGRRDKNPFTVGCSQKLFCHKTSQFTILKLLYNPNVLIQFQNHKTLSASFIWQRQRVGQLFEQPNLRGLPLREWFKIKSSPFLPASTSSSFDCNTKREKSISTIRVSSSLKLVGKMLKLVSFQRWKRPSSRTRHDLSPSHWDSFMSEEGHKMSEKSIHQKGLICLFSVGSW